MSIAVLGLLIVAMPSQQMEGIPKFSYKPAVMAGQREVVLGPQLQPDVVMEVRFDSDVPAQIGEGRIAPPTWMEYAKGYVRWSVTDGTLFEKPCRILKMEGTTKGQNSTKTKKFDYACQNITMWWIRPDGKLLRQSVTLNDPNGYRHAECVYWPDHIECSISDRDHPKNNKSFEFNPSFDLSLLDAQFKPMLDGDKIVTPVKEYGVFDPFTQGFTKYKATITGTFHGTWLATKFEGMHIDISTGKQTQIVYISKENDLVKVDLPESTSIVLDFLPPSRDPLYKIKQSVGKG